MRFPMREWMHAFFETAHETGRSGAPLALDVRVLPAGRGAGDEVESSVRVLAWVTSDRMLAVDVEVHHFSAALEKALYEALDKRTESLVAGLLLWDWRALRDECAARSAMSDPAVGSHAPRDAGANPLTLVAAG